MTILSILDNGGWNIVNKAWNLHRNEVLLYTRRRNLSQIVHKSNFNAISKIEPAEDNQPKWQQSQISSVGNMVSGAMEVKVGLYT